MPAELSRALSSVVSPYVNGAVQVRGDVRVEEAFQQLRHGGVARRLLYGGPYGDDEHASGCEHAHHLLQGRSWWVEKHQPELAKHGRRSFQSRKAAPRRGLG